MINKYLSQISKTLRSTNKQKYNPLVKKSVSLPRLIQTKRKSIDSKNISNKIQLKQYEQQNVNETRNMLPNKRLSIMQFTPISDKKQEDKKLTKQKQKKINRYISLQKIKAEGKFISKNQYSIDTSIQQNQNTTKKIQGVLNIKYQSLNSWTLPKNHKQQSYHKAQIYKKRMSQILDKKLISKNVQQKHKEEEVIVSNKTTIKQIDSIAFDNTKIANNNQKHNQIVESYQTQIQTNNNQFKISQSKQSGVKEQKYVKQKLVGEEAINKFYQKYKNIQKVRQIQQMNFQLNPLTLILTILQSYNIPPKRMEFIKKDGQQSILNLSNLSLGSNVSLNAISDILKRIQGFQSIDLSYNRIVLDLVDVIIPQLSKMIQINLSHNRIGKRGADLLALMCKGQFQQKKINAKAQKIYQNYCLLQQLNLQQNCLSDYSLHSLIDSFISLKQIKILDLSRNYLSNHFAFKLKQYLIGDSCLDQLYLRWNDITSKGSKYIFQGLAQNIHLKVFDFSWNHISFQTIPAMCSFLKKNKSLIHLDISFCDISQNDTIQLSLALKNNHSIYGLHYDGNFGKIDSKGYLIPHNNSQTNNGDVSSLRRGILQKINGVSRKSSSYQKYNSFKHEQSCWICDGWQQRSFQIQQFENDRACFIHFDFEQFKGIAMTPLKFKFQLTKMIPKKQIMFFITKVDCEKNWLHQAGNLITRNNEIQQVQFQPLKCLPKFNIAKKQFKKIKLKSINKMEPKYFCQLFDEYYQTLIQCLPRSQDLHPNSNLFQVDPQILPSEQKLKKKKRIKKKRNAENDKKARQLHHVQNYFIGAGSQKNQEVFRKCVDFDFRHNKISKLVQNNQTISNLKQILYQNYTVFKNIFYHLCNNNPSISGIFNISETRFQQFIEDQHYQTSYYTKAKIRLKLISCLSINDQIKDGEQKLLSRPQFVQFLLRIAIDKFCKKRKNLNEDGQYDQIQPLSVQQAFTRIITKLKKLQDKLVLPNYWRQQFLYSYDVSLVIKSYQHFIQTLYNTYTGTTQKNLNSKTQKKMLLNEFKSIFLDAKIRKTKQALKDAQLSFIQSKTLQVQDGNQQYGLSYIQFLQALIRMAHSVNLKPVNTENQRIWQKIQQMQKHKEIKHSEEIFYQIPLFLKVQSLIRSIYFQRKIHRTRKMDMLFQKGIFSQQIQMLIQILKLRVEKVHEKYRPLMYQKTHHKVKLNSLGQLQTLNVGQNEHAALFKKINLQHLVQELRLKYTRIAEQLDKNFSQYDQVSVKQSGQINESDQFDQHNQNIIKQE